jgi:hypothetical protein
VKFFSKGGSAGVTAECTDVEEMQVSVADRCGGGDLAADPRHLVPDW